MASFYSAPSLLSLLTALLFVASATLPSSPAVAAEPQLVFVPIPQAYSLTKHPTLPVLYVGCSFAPESKNLVTFRIDPAGKLVADSRRDWPDWLSSDPKNGDFVYTYWRPTVWAEKGMLYLGGSIGYRDKFFAKTNSNEFAAIALDAEGLPAKPAQLFRTEFSGKDSVMGIQCDPVSRRLYISYYYQFGWCDLDEQGVPKPTSFQVATGVQHFWDWIWFAQWNRFLSIPGGLGLSIYQLDGTTAQFGQHIFTPDDKNGGGVPRHSFEFSERYQKLYLLRSQPGKELMTLRFTKEGKLTSVPRHFSIGPTIALRFNFKAGLLYAFATDQVRTFALDAEGYPTGTPTVREFKCGDIRDVIVDGTTHTAYVACTQPP